MKLVDRASFFALVVVLLVSCQERQPASEPPAPGPTREPIAEEVAEPGLTRIVFLGDSLTAGFGLPEEEAFPALVAERLERAGFSVRVVNAGVSGDTSAGGLSRMEWLLRQEPDILFVSLGANDGLRGLSPAMTESNLRRIVERGRAAGARVVVAGMRLPPNYGPAYVDQFEAVFPRLAEELDVEWIPFLLEGVAGDPELNLADGIHPNPAGHRIIANLVFPVIEPLVREEAAAAF